MEVEWPCECVFPDLSELGSDLLGHWTLSTIFREQFPPGTAALLVSTFVRTLEAALREYEQARERLEAASREGALMGFLRGCSDMEATFWILHRAMRQAEALVNSPETLVGWPQLPAEAEREKLRKMRNAIDHDAEPILAGRAGSGEMLALAIDSTQMSISDRDMVEQVVTHTEFAQWVRTLHGLAVELIDNPSDWANT